MRKQANPLKAGDRLVVRGVMWHEPQWEFDAPVVLYQGVKAYSPNYGSIGAGSVLDFIFEQVEMAAAAREVRRGWSPSELKEFGWRRWSTRGFRKRRGVHAMAEVEFVEGVDGFLEYKVLQEREVK